MRRPAWGEPRRFWIPVEHARRRARATMILGLFTLVSACVPRSRMCTTSSECADKSACVAGRCQLEKVGVKPAVDSARRLVLRPVDLAYSTSGDSPSGGALPATVVLGKCNTKLFLRFSVALPETANVIEAYVVLHRSKIVDDDPVPISLHATRIVESWTGGSLSWAMQPRSTETRSPSTIVEPGGGSIVRLDVRELVRQWGRRDPSDEGIVIVADTETKTGTTFALSNVGAERTPADAPFVSRSGSSPNLSAWSSVPDVEPYLEIYVR